jgi:pantothenate kinase
MGPDYHLPVENWLKISTSNLSKTKFYVHLFTRCRPYVHRHIQIRCHNDGLFDSCRNMEDVYTALTARVLKRADSVLSNASTKRYIIGIAGGPGSGKSTLAKTICKRLNKVENKRVAVNVPMDGFHFYKKQLDTFPDPKAAYARRGAHWTFDATAYVDCIKKLKQGRNLKAPSFDHGVGDPRPDDIDISDDQHIIVSEGNYLLLDVEPWSQLTNIFDEKWYLECPQNEAMWRVFKRQISDGVTAKDSRERIEGNDRLNFIEIAGTVSRADIIIPFLPFGKKG